MKRASVFFNGIITVDTFGNILCDGINLSQYIQQAVPIEKKIPVEYQEKQFSGTVTLILSDLSENPEIHQMGDINLNDFGLNFAQYQKDRQEGPNSYEKKGKEKEIEEGIRKILACFKGEKY